MTVSSCYGWPCGSQTWTETKDHLKALLASGDEALDEGKRKWLLHIACAHGGLALAGFTTVTIKNRRLYAMPGNVSVPFTSLRKDHHK